MSITGQRSRRVILFIFGILCICLLLLVSSAEPAFGQSKSSIRKTRVQNVTVTSVNRTTLNVSWHQVEGAEGYYIYASKSRLSRFHRVKVVHGGNKTNSGIGSCVPGKTYYFKVQAFADQKTGKKSNAVAGATDASGSIDGARKGASSAGKLKTPTFTAEKYGSTEIKIKIGKLSGVKGFIIYRAKTKAGKYTKVKTTSASKRTYIDSGLKASTKYYYKVRAYQVVSGKKQYSAYSTVQWAKTKAAPNGNAAKYDVSNIKFVESDLKGKSAYFLGSSVTAGKGSEGQSFVDMLEKKYGMIVTKQAFNGTTLVTTNPNSYIKRMLDDEKMLKNNPPDYFVCQLSTNDASKGSALGELKKGYDISLFNTKEVAGAIEYITAYAQQNLHRPVIFYVQTKFKTEVPYTARYEEMINLLYKASEKWGDQLQIVDMWNDPKLQYTSTDDRLLCMFDAIHPTKAGYLTKFVVAFEKYFNAALEKMKGGSEPQTYPQETENIETLEQAPEGDLSTETIVTTNVLDDTESIEDELSDAS